MEKIAVFEYLAWRRVGLLTPLMQAICIIVLYIATTAYTYSDYQQTGLMFGYPLSISILFVPIYEEILFRGMIFRYLQDKTTVVNATIATSILFGLWHVKNIFFLPIDDLLYQIIYASVIVSPIFCYITYMTKTIWPAVILHYVNNLAAPLSWVLLERFL